MLDMTKQAGFEEKVEELLLDGGYDSVTVLEETLKQDISVLCAPHNKGSKKK